jgi:hypothetical protein
MKGVDSHLSTGPTLRHDKKGCVDLGHSEAHRFRKHGFMVWVALDGRLRPGQSCFPRQPWSNTMSFYRQAKFSESDAAVWKTD